MHIDQLVKLLFGRLGEWRVNAKSSIIDEEVKIVPLPYLFERLLDHFSKGGKGLRIRHIELQCHSFATTLLDRSDHPFCFFSFVIVSQNNVMPFRGDIHRHCFSKSTASASNDCYFHEHSFAVYLRWLLLL